MPPPDIELYVYYRIAANDASRLWPAVLAWQKEVSSAHPGLIARLLQRPAEDGPADAPRTWMETYAALPASATALRSLIEAGAPALAPHLTGARHVEVFEPCTVTAPAPSPRAESPPPENARHAR